MRLKIDVNLSGKYCDEESLEKNLSLVIQEEVEQVCREIIRKDAELQRRINVKALNLLVRSDKKE